MSRGRRSDLARAVERGVNPEVAVLIDRAVREVISAATREVLATARKAVLQGASNTLYPMSKNTSNQTRAYIDSKKLEFYDRLGRKAWNVMMDRLGEMFSRGDTMPLRTKNRLPGKLREAFGRDFYHYDTTGLYFGDTQKLYAMAAHWHRLTFGAAPIGKGIHTSYDLNYQGQVFGRVGVDGDPSRAFLMPPGIWIGAGGGHPTGDGDTFFPVNSSRLQRQAGARPKHLRPHKTHGITTHDFISPGLQTLASEFGPELDRLIRGIKKQILQGIPAEIKTTVKARAPRIQPIVSSSGYDKSDPDWMMKAYLAKGYSEDEARNKVAINRNDNEAAREEYGDEA